MSAFLAYLAVSLIVIVTPGPDTAVTIRNALLGGRSGGVFTALGIAVGQTIWAFATSLGVVALLTASAPLFLAVKYAGAAWLVWLGVQALREAVRPDCLGPSTAFSAASRRSTRFGAFRQGLVSDLGNPKMAIFFASLLPQFVAPGEASVARFMLLGIVFAAMTFSWLAVYAVALAKLGERLRRPAVRRAFAAATGALLIGLGVRVAAEQR
jgi:threonine/homoserine/homoserine lactone efflux protein